MCAGSPKQKSYYTTTLPFYIETSYKNILALLPSVIAKILRETWCVFLFALFCIFALAMILIVMVYWPLMWPITCDGNFLFWCSYAPFMSSGWLSPVSMTRAHPDLWSSGNSCFYRLRLISRVSLLYPELKVHFVQRFNFIGSLSGWPHRISNSRDFQSCNLIPTSFSYIRPFCYLFFCFIEVARQM